METSRQSTYNQGFMRRGTHSCVECRRRKIRCLYSRDDQTSCIACLKKGRQCQEQTREHFPSTGTGKKNKSLKDRVAKLEALLKSTGLELEKDSIAGQSTDHEASEFVTPERSDRAVSRDISTDFGGQSILESDEDDDDTYEQDPDPLVSLFNSSLLQSRESKQDLKILDTYQQNIDQRVTAKRNNVLFSLRTPIVSPYLLRDILAVTCDWFQGWRPLGPWPVEYTVAAGYSTLQDFLLFAYDSEVPAVVGLAVLCVAESIRKLQVQTPTHAELIEQLPRPPQELFQILFERVDSLVNADSDFSNTREGIDCLLMSGKLFSGLGLPRRTWITFHKVIIYGQFHGLHRALPRAGETKDQRQARQNAWDNLCQTDLFISMTLGLPYITAGRNIPLIYYGEPGAGPRFRKQLMSAAALVIDRNQSGLINELEPTKDIMKALDDAAAPMSADFWTSPERLMQLLQDPVNATIENKRQLVEESRWQMFYWLIKMFTHLPLGIRSMEQPNLRPHRLICEDGCRGNLKVYNILRNDRRADLPNLIDYQAFISCSVLILGLLGYGETPEKDLNLSHQVNIDRELVAITLQTLRNASEGTANAVAGQALEGLEDLFRVAYPEPENQGSTQKDVRTKITIPYIGTITVSKRGHARPEGVTNLTNSPQLPVPVFSFAYPDAFTPPDMGSQYYKPPQADFNHLNQGSMPTVVDVMNDGYTSINFDFDQLMEVNTGDWTWISNDYGSTLYHP